MQNVFNQTGLASDWDIIKGILNGEIALFEVLIRRYNPVLYKIARGYGFNHHDAEDLMQETHVSAYEHLPQFEGRAMYKTWISKIMVHKCLYKLKHGYYKRETTTEQIQESLQTMPMKTNHAQPDEGAVNKELALILEKSLERIPTIYRSVFVLREAEGFSVKETAELLGVTETNVKVRLNRAKALLQKEIEQFYSRPEIYSFNQVYCDAMVQKVFARIGGQSNP